MKYWLLLFLLQFTNNLFAQLIITSNKEVIQLDSKNLTYFISKRSDSIPTIIKHLSDFKPISNTVANFGFEPNDIWFKFQVKNPSSIKLIRYLHLNNPIIDEVDLYKQVVIKDPLTIEKTGIVIYFSNWN